MTALTMMERTATGWKCPRCASTREDDLLPVRAVECNCAFESLNGRYPGIQSNDSMPMFTAQERSKTQDMDEAAPKVLTAEVGVPLRSAAEAIDAARSALDAATGVPDAFRYGPIVTLMADDLRKRYPGEVDSAVATRTDLPKDVLAALEYVRDHLHHASNYSEVARTMARRYLLWVLKPKPEGATLTECGNRHKIWRVVRMGDRCPVCVGWEET